MLQQTQVATVQARYYGPFLKQFPTAQALAAAPREAVMKAWEGLGYYRRAGHLHEAAKVLVKQATQRCDAYDALIALPGIGKNTAHAILAFAFHQPAAICEANIKRIVARIFALTTPSDAELWQAAEALLNTAEPFHHNQAMMDLGALLCTPKAPDCKACPAHTLCKGKKTPEDFPQKKVKKSVPTKQVFIVVQRDSEGRYHLQKRGEKLLGGLYGFTQQSRPPRDAQTLGKLTHIYSHFRLEAQIVLQCVAQANSPDWYTQAQIKMLPLSTLDKKVLALVKAC